MRGKILETVPFQLYFVCTESFLKVLSDKYFQATRAMRAKQAVTVPLQLYFGFHLIIEKEVWKKGLATKGVGDYHPVGNYLLEHSWKYLMPHKIGMTYHWGGNFYILKSFRFL